MWHIGVSWSALVLTAFSPGEPGLAGCPLNFPSSFIPELYILLGQTQTIHVILNTIPPGLFRASSLIPSTSHVILRLTQSLSSFRSTCPNHLNLLNQTSTNRKNATEQSLSAVPINTSADTDGSCLVRGGGSWPVGVVRGLRMGRAGMSVVGWVCGVGLDGAEKLGELMGLEPLSLVVGGTG